ncbi:MAG: PspC domain-containing protein [Bacteroidota bacterium]
MNKVININFQGSIIPIEESASELLRNYIQSLRQYFANEEGRDEIISDIESRIAELFLQRLKKGNTCITDMDMKEIMSGIGHPEDLHAAESESGIGSESTTAQQKTERNQTNSSEQKRLYRASNNQLVGGVAAGLADYLGIDVSILRVIMIFSLFAGFGFVVYLVLWAVLPEKEMNTFDTHKRRLFRNPEEKKLGGVASGLAAYFSIDVWILRIIFLSPILLFFVGNSVNSWFDKDITDFIFRGFGGSLFVIYFVLWAVLPEANTAAEKLQMRGEKVDLESIKKTVNEEMQNLKGRAEQWSKDAGKRAAEKAKMMQSDFTQTAKNMGNQTNTAARRSASGVSNAVGILARIFVFGIIGILIFSLLMGFAGLTTWLLTGHQIINFILVDETEHYLLWATLILFIGVPVVGLLMWLVRAVRGVQTRNKYVGYTFTFLHVLGWISFFALFSFIGSHFHSKSKQSSVTNLITPSGNTLLVVVDPFEDEDLIEDWRSGSPWPKMNKMEDSIYAANIKVKVLQSKDSLFHVRVVKSANGKTFQQANRLAEAIQYSLFQNDSVLHLSKYFSLSKKDKFHLQQVSVVVEVPLGAKVKLDRTIQNFEWHDIRINTGNGFNIEHYDDESTDWEYDRVYQMGTQGLSSADIEVRDKGSKI